METLKNKDAENSITYFTTHWSKIVRVINIFTLFSSYFHSSLSLATTAQWSQNEYFFEKKSETFELMNIFY